MKDDDLFWCDAHDSSGFNFGSSYGIRCYRWLWYVAADQRSILNEDCAVRVIPRP